MCVCMYVCVYVCIMYVCVRMYVCVCTMCVCMYVYMYVLYVYVCMYVYVRVYYACTHVFTSRSQTPIHTPTTTLNCTYDIPTFHTLSRTQRAICVTTVCTVAVFPLYTLQPYARPLVSSFRSYQYFHYQNWISK
jgi:hypothetical protein